MNKRSAFKITIRRLATGTDYTRTLWLRDRADAFTRMMCYVPRNMTGQYRLVSCDPDPTAVRACDRT